MLRNALVGLLETAKGWSGEAVVLRLLAATIVGVVIGTEREHRNKDAGIKTHALVCVGAQVISGVGFRGVGTNPSSASTRHRSPAKLAGARLP